MELFYILAGVILGVLSGWWIQKFRLRVGERQSLENVDRLEARVRQLEQEKVEAVAWLGGLREQLEQVRLEVGEREGEVRRLGAQLAATESVRERLEKDMEAEKKAAAELMERVKADFKNLATEIMGQTTAKVTEQNKAHLESVLNPLKENLVTFRQRIDTTQEEQAKARGELIQELKQLKELNVQLSTEAHHLTQALKGDTKTQGNWGEFILESVLERSGLTRGVEFEVQESYTNEEGRRFRPDVVIRFPDDRGGLIVDSKVSLTAYERYASADEEAVREQALREHVASVRGHVKELAEKDYQSLLKGTAPDFVLLFVPLEPAFTVAMQHQPGLYEEAFEKRVILITPSTLLATLRLVKTLWNQDRQNRHALEIADRAGALYDKLVDCHEAVVQIGVRLDQARNTWEEAKKRLGEGRGNAIRQVEELRKLGAKARKSFGTATLDRAMEDDEMALEDKGEPG
jgi:DNA recombination protein RmuC